MDFYSYACRLVCVLLTEQAAAVVSSHRYAHQDKSNQMPKASPLCEGPNSIGLRVV